MNITAASLRNYPLLDIDLQRVSDRAYYLWKSEGGDAADNWLKGEAAEVAHQAQLALIFPEGFDRFLRDYSLLTRIRFITGTPHQKQHIGTRFPQSCTLCQATSAEFRKEAHVLPACTGCRWLLTYDECDACNAKYGQLYDGELGNMLLPDRVLGRVPTRGSPSAKLKIRNLSWIGGQGSGAPLAMQVHAEDDSVRFEHIDPNTICVTMKGMPYYRVRAVKSLARTAWHLLSPDERQRNTGLVQWIRGEREYLPFTYYSGFVPGAGLRHTTFAIWRAKAATELACMFVQANRFLLFNTPDWVSGSQSDLPLPPLPHTQDGDLSVKRIRVDRDSRVEAPTISYTISHGSRRVTWTGGPKNVTCNVSLDGRQVQLQATCAVHHSVDGWLEYRIEGGDVIGRLVLSPGPSSDDDSEAQQPQAQFAYEADTETGEGDVEKTIDLLTALCHGGRVVVKLLRPDWFVLDIESPGMLESADFEALRRHLEERRLALA